MSAPIVVSLLPARNAADDLPAHLASVAQFADVVIALDDGSTDDTRAVLEAHPLVHTVLTNPSRDHYAGWDDAANRNRLLAAALELRPTWIMSLDADELLANDDAAALRAFLRDGADPTYAYLFPVFRMIDDLEHYDDDRLWVGRLFASQPGHVFPSHRLHLAPIPTAIPSERWRRTTIRIQHRAAMTVQRRSARFEKYRDADANRDWQGSYAHLLDAPGRVRPWSARCPQLPTVANEPVLDPTPLELDEPAISVIVIARNDEASIERAVGAVVSQQIDEPIEVIVVTSGTDRTATMVREGFPTVTVVELDHSALPGQARNAGLRVARGRYVTFPGSHIEMAPGSLAARLAAHRRGWAMVTETMLNGTHTWTGWASYFLDNASVLPGRPSFAFVSAPPRCSYVRDVLLEIGGFPEDLRAGEDTDVNEELFRRGYGAYRERDAMAYHHSPCQRPGRLLIHHFQWGRAMGRIVADASRQPGHLRTRRIERYVLTSLPGRLYRTHERVVMWGHDLRRPYRFALPLIAAGAVASWVGGCYELVRQRALRRPTNAHTKPLPVPAGEARGSARGQPRQRDQQPNPFPSAVAPADDDNANHRPSPQHGKGQQGAAR